MTTQFKNLPLIAPQQPRLPSAPAEYSQQYGDTLTNILRLYFNQLQNFNQLFTTNTGGALLQFPNGAFHQDGNTTLTANMTNNSTTPIEVVSTENFTPAGQILIGAEVITYTAKTPTTFTGITRGTYGTTNVAHTAGVSVAEALGTPSSTTSIVLPFTNTDASNGVELDSADTSHIVFTVSGYYNIQFSAQLANFTTSDDNVTLWFRQNGVDVPNSAGVQAVSAKHGSFPGAAIISWNIILPISAGDYLELVYASDSGDTVLVTYPAGTAPVHPVSPSCILTATFVSALFPAA